MADIFFFSYTAPTEIYTLSLHDALPISRFMTPDGVGEVVDFMPVDDPELATDNHVVIRLVRVVRGRSEEHTSELQSRENLVCRLLLEKKNVCVVIGITIGSVFLAENALH